MKKEFIVIWFFIIGLILLSAFSMCNAAPAPSVEYDLTNKYNASLDLSNNGQNKETIESWWTSETSSCTGCEPNENMRPESIHGIICYTNDLIIKNNGFQNLTNVTIISYHEIVKIIPVLSPNETFSIRIEEYEDPEILTEQGVYANFYTTSYSGSCWTFELNFFSLIAIIIGVLFIAFWTFYVIKYKKTKKRLYFAISVITIILAVIFLILAFLFGWVCYL
jgi:hypothetical protein